MGSLFHFIVTRTRFGRVYLDRNVTASSSLPDAGNHSGLDL